MSEELGWYARVEGCDGAGKTTQIKMLQQYSKEKGIDAVFLREPGGTNFGAKIRSLILDKHDTDPSATTEFLLFTADRSHTCDEIIMPALEKDQLVVSDRGIESTICYQSAAGGLDVDTIMNISKQVLPARYIRPDTLAVLSVSKEIRRMRLSSRFGHTAADRIESKDDSYSDRVYEGYQSLGKLDYATIVDANRSEEEVHEQLVPVIFGEYMRRHSGVYLPTNTQYHERTSSN